MSRQLVLQPAFLVLSEQQVAVLLELAQASQPWVQLVSLPVVSVQASVLVWQQVLVSLPVQRRRMPTSDA